MIIIQNMTLLALVWMADVRLPGGGIPSNCFPTKVSGGALAATVDWPLVGVFVSLQELNTNIINKNKV